MRRLIFSLVVIFIITAGILTVILFNTDPNADSPVVSFAFFLCLWLVAWLFFSLISLTALVLAKRPPTSRGIVLRRSLELATVIVGTILFSSLGVLNGLSLISLILIAILLELFFVSRRREITRK